MVGVFDGRFEDISFPSKGLKLTLAKNQGGGRAVETTYAAADAVDPIADNEQVQAFEDWSTGACYSQDPKMVTSYGNVSQKSGTYATGSFITTRFPGSLMPSGAITEIPILLTSNGTLIEPGYCNGSVIIGGSLFVLMGRYIVRIHDGDEDILGVGTLDGNVVSEITHTTVNGGLDLGASATASDIVLFSGDDGFTYAFMGTEGVGDHAVLWRLTTSETGVVDWTHATGTDAPRVSKLGVAFQTDITSETIRGNLRLFGLLNCNQTISGQYHLARRSFIFCQEPNDPMQAVADVWTAGYRIGGGRYDCRKIVSAGQRVMFLCENGIMDVNLFGHSPNVTPYWEQQLDDANGNCGMIINGLLMAAHAAGLDSYPIPDNDALLQQKPGYIGPGEGISNETNISGPPWAIEYFDGYAIGAFFNGTDSFLMYGEQEGDNGPWKWTGPEAVMFNQKITHLKVYSLGAPQTRLLIATVDAATETVGRLYWQSIQNSNSPIQEFLNNRDAAGNYNGSHRWSKRHSVIQSASSFSRQSSVKVIVQTRIRADNLSTETFYRAYVSAEDQTYHQQGTGPDGDISDPKATISPRSQLLPSRSLATGHNLTLKLSGEAPDANSPPNGSGLISSATANTITDTTQTSSTWPTNFFSGYTLKIIQGTGTGQSRIIVSNTSDTLTVDSDFSTTPEEGDEYLIVLGNSVGTFTSSSTTVLTDNTKTWTDDQWIGYILELSTFSDETGETTSRVIVDNDSTSVTVHPPFDTAPDVGLTYSIGRGYTIKPAILRGAEIVVEEIVETRPNKTYTVILGQLNEGKTTSRAQIDPYAQLDRLLELHKAPPLYMIDESGKRVYVRVKQVMNIKEVQYKRDTSDSYGIALQCQFTVSQIPSTTEEIGIDTPNKHRAGSNAPGGVDSSLGFKWNSGARWNSGRKWR